MAPAGAGSELDVGSVIEKVRHAVTPVGRDGVLRVEDWAYAAEFGGEGFSLTLRRPAGDWLGAGSGERFEAGRERPDRARRHRAGASASIPDGSVPPFEDQPAFELSTTAVHVGDKVHAVAEGWRGAENRAQRVVSPFLLERVTAGDGALEWDFVVGEPPAEGGELRIDATVSSKGAPAAFTGEAGERGVAAAWRWALPGNRGVAMGELVVIDAAGRELYRADPSVTGQTVSLAVPAKVLASADYPLTLDPVVSPEYPTSEPVYGPAADSRYSPAVAFDGTNHLVVWEDCNPGSPPGCDIYGARVSREGVVLDGGGIAISTADNTQSSPAVAFDGTSYLVVWHDRRNRDTTDLDIYGARVTPAGVVLDGGGIDISTAANGQYDPTIAFDGANYLVVWEDGRRFPDDIYGARVTPAGVVLDGGGIDISTADNTQSSPAIAFDGINYLVLWEDWRRSVPRMICNPFCIRDHTIYGARVTTQGVVLDAEGIAISTVDHRQVLRDLPNQFPGGFYSQRSPAVAFDGINYLVVWEDGRDWGSGTDIYGARVSPAGVVLDQDGIAISTAVDNQYSPAVRFDGTNYLVVWHDRRNRETTDIDIYGARVTPLGVVLDGGGIAVSTAVDDQYSPAVAFDGTNYLVVWEDRRTYATTGTSDIYGARVTREGASSPPEGIAIAMNADD